MSTDKVPNPPLTAQDGRTLFAVDQSTPDPVIDVLDYVLDRETGERFARVILDVDGPLWIELPLNVFEAVNA